MRKMLIVFAGFLLFISINNNAQPPMPRFSNKGDSLYAEGNIPEAIAEYRILVNAKKISSGGEEDVRGEGVAVG